MDKINEKSQKPRYKEKGPIRVEAIGPFLIFAALVFLYFTLFFDAHLRKGIEWAATYANGAEVNVGHLRTSFLKASLEMGGIEVTDPKEPARNRVEIGRVRFQALWDALLRAKFVVTEASVTDIGAHTPRKRPGRVLPVESKEGRSEILAKAREKLIEAAGLEGIAKMLEGFDPNKALQQITGELQSAKKIAELQGELDRKQKEWEASLASLPSEKDLASLQQKISSISAGGSNPAEIQQKISSVSSLLKESQDKVGSVKSKGDALLGDVNGFQKSVASVDDVIAQDRKAMESKMKLPSLDTESLSRALFGEQLMSQVSQAEHYKSLLQKYMPEKPAAKKAEKKEKQEPPRWRGGKTYSFGRPNTYPTFWLKEMRISSKQGESEYSGDVEGRLTDLSSEPEFLPRPALLTVKGDFPKQGVMGVELLGTLDHRKHPYMESLKVSLASFPVAGRVLSQSDTVKFAFAKALGAGTVEGTLREGEVAIAAHSAFRDVAYDIASSNKMLESTLLSAVKSVPSVEVDAKASGSWENLGFSITSNLGAALARGFQGALKARVDEARAKLDAMIQEKVGKQKAQLASTFESVKSKFTGQVDARKKQAEGVQNLANAKIDELKKQANPANKGADQLKKKFKF